MNNTEEGQEKLRRRKLFQKAGKLEQSWSLMRECKDYLEENDERLKKRTREETARLREEEKLERLEMVKMKKAKYKLKEKTKNMMEIAEMKQHLWRNYRVQGESIQPNLKKR
jgi:hypothetical protein